jgi:hypothetical protein
MAAFLSHPSLYLTFIVLPFWENVVTSPVIQKQEFYKDICTLLVNSCEKKFEKVDAFKENPIKHPANDFLLEDFAARHEYLQFFGAFIGKLRDVVRHVTLQMPELATQLALSKIMEILTNFPSNYEDLKDLQLGRVVNFTDSVLQVIENMSQKAQLTSSPLLESLNNICLTYINADLKEPQYIVHILSGIQSCIPCLRIQQTLVEKALNKIFSYISFGGSVSPSKTIHPGIISLRRKAGTVLIHLTMQIPHCFLVLFL